MSHRLIRLSCYLLAVVLCFFVALAELPADALSNAAVEARMLADLKYLASEECEGRGILTKGLDLAADYIAQRFQEAGLKPGNAGSYFQPFEMNTGSRLVGGQVHNRLVLKGPLGQELVLEMGKHYTVLGFGGSGRVSAPLVFAGYGVSSEDPAYDDYRGLDVAGKVVIVLRNLPRQSSRDAPLFPANDGQINRLARLDAKASNAEVHKAAAVLFVNDNQLAAESNDALRSFNETASSFDPVGIPVLHLRRSLANMLVRSHTGQDLSALERSINQEAQPHSFPLEGWSAELETRIEKSPRVVKNVVAVAEGSGPLAEETIVVGAHYDHLGRGERGSLAAGSREIHYGADDNASGTTVLLELARRFGSQPDRKGRRIVFIAFTAEERGLIGSRYYTNNPLFPLDKTVAMINLDMVGRLREDKIQVFGVGTAKEFAPLLDQLNGKHKFALNKSLGTQMVGGSSDHESFNRKNIPTLFFFTGNHPQYHRPSDTWDLINVEGMRRIAELVEDILVGLGTLEKRPEFVRVTAPPALGGVTGPRGPTLGIMPAYSEDDGQEGLLLDGVSPGRPAEKAGLKAGDRIVEINGKPIKNIQNYMTVMSGFKKGEKIEVTVLRDGKPQKFAILLE
jgi:hypothetical protein